MREHAKQRLYNGTGSLREAADGRWTVRQWVLALLASLTLLWPALVNGGPFWFPDTPTYIRGADAAFVYVTGQRSEWSDRIKIAPTSAASAESKIEPGNAQAGQITPTRPVLVGRSIYYGFLLYMFLSLGGPWLAVTAQCLGVGLLGTYAIWRVLHLAGSRHASKAWLAMPVLAVVSPLAYFACMFMPDVYAGLGLLTLSVALAYWSRLSVVDRVVFLGSSAIMATFHSTHILIFAALTGVMVLRAILLRSKLSVPLVVGGVAIVAGLASNAIFAAGVRHATSVEPESPPFLTARLQEHELGLAFLKDTCADDGSTFVVCKYADRLPLDSDTFLWSEEQGEGIVQTIPATERRAMAAQDKPFFLAVAAHDPVRFAGVVVASTLEQLVSFDMLVFNYPHRAPDDIAKAHPNAVTDHILATRAAHGTMPVQPMLIVSIVSALISTILALWLLVRFVRIGKVGDEISAFIALIIMGVLANAMICGALSGPKGRYQMRLIWIVPAAALVVVGSHGLPGQRREDALQAGYTPSA